MKEFTVKSKDKEYKVKANDFRSAVKAVKAVTAKDEASQLDVIQALVTDEQAAIAAYTNAIENLDGKVDPQYVEVLRNILKEENKHVENLQAIITGNVTEKNVEDSVKDELIARLYKSALGDPNYRRVQLLLNGKEIASLTANAAKQFAAKIAELANFATN